MLRRLDSSVDKEALIEWLSARQSTGFQGRVNKVPDSCYGFWCGASLQLLGVFDQVVDPKNLSGFVLACGQQMGGFGKHPDAHPDVSILRVHLSFCDGRKGVAHVLFFVCSRVLQHCRTQKS